jgi:large subunit ribosomal protein L6e
MLSYHPSVISVSTIIIIAVGGPQRKSFKNNAKTWYPADDEKTHFKRKRNQPKPTQGRNVAAGNVVIILSGKHRGRRVVVLKKLASNNLLVTGPHSVNGVPLKRVNGAYAIVTSTKVPLDGVDVSKIDDAWFKSNKKYRPSELKNAS